MSAVVEFTVIGTPTTQGSKRAFVTTSRLTGKPRAVMFDQKPERLQSWRGAVSTVAISAMAGRDPFTGPITATLAFALKRPASAPKTRRTWPIGKGSGDNDKLARAVLDALTDAGVWGDDAQVTNLHISKDYCLYGSVNHIASPGVWIRIHAPEHLAQERLT